MQASAVSEGAATEARPRSAPRSYMESVRREHGFEPLRIEGTIPRELSGTLVRNGPGLYERFGVPYDHSFEGDGLLSAMRFEGGRVEGALRLIESAGRAKERAAGKPLYGSNAPFLRRLLNGLTLDFKNTANTSVMVWQERLFALMEAGRPTEVSPHDLSTLGATDLGKVIHGPFSAHPHRVAARRASDNFGVRAGPRTYLDLYELPDVGAARCLGSLQLARPVMLHDFVATEKHLVFLVSPVKLHVLRAIFGIGGFSELFTYDAPAGVEVIVVPIDELTRTRRFHVPSFFQWHFAGAWEEGREIVLHVCRYEDFGTFENLARKGIDQQGHLTEIRIDADEETLRSERVWEGAAEFPSIHPRCAGARYRHVFFSSEGDSRRGLASVDLDAGRRVRAFWLDEGLRPSEPVFVPRGGGSGAEDDGWLLSLVYSPREHASYVGVWDAQRIEDGPVGKAWFGEHVPMTFHGAWMPR